MALGILDHDDLCGFLHARRCCVPSRNVRARSSCPKGAASSRFPSTILNLVQAKRLRALHPEKSKDLYAESEKIEWTIKELLNRTILRPLKMLLVEPILLLVTVYLSVVYGVIYASELMVPEPYPVSP